MQDNTRSSLPYPVYYWIVFLLCLAGIADAVYLAVSHLKNYTDITYSSFCAISKAINCDTVSQSPWSIFFGIPVAHWGIIGYLLFLLFLIPLRKINNATKPLWSILFLLALFFSITAVFFGYISSSKIQAYCIMCLLSYGISFSLLFYSWIIRRRFDDSTFLTSLKKAANYVFKSRILKITLTALACSTLCLKIVLPSYWEFELPPLAEDMHQGTTDDGHPWIGAENPRLIIKEFSDYQCFQCYKIHFLLRRLIAEHPDKIRLIHYHYPMDHQFNSIVVPEPFHIGSGKMALLGIYASTRKIFWEMNDLLYQFGRSKEPFSTKELAQALVLPPTHLVAAIDHPDLRILLQNDIRTGGMAGITGTPSYIINEKIYEGSIPPEIIQDALQ